MSFVKKKSALVTGGNGHLGFHLVTELCENGYQVRATVRNLSDPQKVERLIRLRKTYPDLEIVELDLVNEKQAMSAVAGIQYVFHVAAPNLLWAKDEKREMWNPILEGTKNIIRAALAEEAISPGKKIVFTSSCGVVGTHARDRDFTEDDWNDSVSAPYLRAKLQAERWAGDFTLSGRLPFVSLCVPSMIGPGYQRTPPGMNLFEEIVLKNRLAIPQIEYHIVDVRDVATLHRLAAEEPGMQGRYLLTGHRVNSQSFMQEVEKSLSGKIIKKFIIPNFALDLFCIFDFLKSKVTGKERTLTRDLVRDFKGARQLVCGQKLASALPRFRFRPLAQTFDDIFSDIFRLQASPQIIIPVKHGNEPKTE